jgi:DNA gyrase/topoisomerase IV subunit A
MEDEIKIVAAQRLRQRVQLIEGLLDALGRIDDVNHVVRACPNRASAEEALHSPPFDYSPVVANHVLDLTVTRQTTEAIKDLQREREESIESAKRLSEER